MDPPAKWGIAISLIGAGAIYWAWRPRVRCYKKKKSGIIVQDLRDPLIRAEHDRFNMDLVARFPDKDAIEVDDDLDGVPVFLVHKHSSAMQVVKDHESFTSNPWPGVRSIVTLNTMSKADHDRVYRIVRHFYTPGAIMKIEELVTDLVREHGKQLIIDGDVFKFSKRFHMHLSLITSGVAPRTASSDNIIDEFVKYNDTAVKITAPLGGVGNRPSRSFKKLSDMGLGICRALPGVIGMLKRIGIINTFRLLNPWETVFPSAPYTHVWDHPDELAIIPAYFNRLFDLMSLAGIDTPGGALFHEIGKSITAAEALGTAVQLMVNMTTANAIQSLVYRRCQDPKVSMDDIFLWDAPLQRNPRRALKDSIIGNVFIPRGSLVLLMVGATNLTCPTGGTSLTFGFGLHHCLGRHLATMEVRKVHEWLNVIDPNCAISVEGTPIRLTTLDVGNWGFQDFRIRLQRNKA